MATNKTSSVSSIRKFVSFAGGLLSQIPIINNPSSSSSTSTTPRPYIPFGNAPSCPSNSPLSCHNSTTAPDSCCFIYPGGQLLQTQFWDYSPAIGPVDSWTLHGLWYVSLIKTKNLKLTKIIGPIFAMVLIQPIVTKPLDITILHPSSPPLGKPIFSPTCPNTGFPTAEPPRPFGNTR